MTANTLWSIAFGDYEFTIDRKALTYRLVETKTGTVWADWLSVGSIEFEDRQTGERTTVDFSQTKLISLSEKASPHGKRILFGLDWNGLPIDINFTCSLHEIELIVEASRDTRTYRVQNIALLPGLCSIPREATSHLVLPYHGGAIIPGDRVREPTLPLSVWDDLDGVNMPFVGAVRHAENGDSALSLITDSAYARFAIGSSTQVLAALTSWYGRDPERRRLDLRITPLPHGDAISIARSYRDKMVRERTHIPLRRKARERTNVEQLFGAAMILAAPADLHLPALISTLRLSAIDRCVCMIRNSHMLDSPISEALRQIEDADYISASVVHPFPSPDFTQLAATNPAQAIAFGFLSSLNLSNEIHPELAEMYSIPPAKDRWAEMEQRMELIASARAHYTLVGSFGRCDWSALGVDFWYAHLPSTEFNRWVPCPLLATVYHDSVVCFGAVEASSPRSFLQCLLQLSPPLFADFAQALDPGIAFYQRVYAVLSHLHRLSFSAFLNSHQFLTSDFTVEEARYTNGARVLINQSETEEYVTEELHLPPLGFYAEHAQMTAHYALRVGAETFPTHAWRVARSRDGKPLAESADVLREEFPVETK